MGDESEKNEIAKQGGFLNILGAASAPWWITGIAIPLTAWIWGLHNERIATAQANTQLVVTLFPYLSDTDPSGIKRDLALALLQQMGRDHTLAPELQASVNAILSNLTSKVEAKTATPGERHTLTEYAKRQDVPVSAISIADTNAPAAPPAPVPAAAPLPPRVYIQIFGQQDLVLANKAKDVLEAGGTLVPHVEDVERVANGKRIPIGYKKTTLVYFNDADRPRAQTLAQDLEKAGVGAIVVPSEANTHYKVPPGQLELWFAKSEPVAP